MNIWTRGKENGGRARERRERERERRRMKDNKCGRTKGRREWRDGGKIKGWKNWRWNTWDEGCSNAEPIFQHLRSLPRFLLPRQFVSTRRFAWDKGSGHGDDSNRIWLSAIFIRPPRPPLSPFQFLPFLAREPSGSEFVVRRIGLAGIFLSDEWMDGRKRELDPANGLLDLIYVLEKQSSMEFQVQDEIGNIRLSLRDIRRFSMAYCSWLASL